LRSVGIVPIRKMIPATTQSRPTATGSPGDRIVPWSVSMPVR
jgi:hypothetical protein